MGEVEQPPTDSPLINSFPVLPPSSNTTSIVMFACPALMTSLSVNAVIRSFSNASLALDKSSRRKTSLCEYKEWMTSERSRAISDYGHSVS